MDDNNSFSVRVPVYGKTGLHVNSAAGGFQHYYLPSDSKTISYGTSYTDVDIIMGNAPYHDLQFVQARGIGTDSSAIQ